MILRRIADGVREQNWITVVIEVAVVMVGIFLGLQVENWNQTRKDRIAEQDFIGRLHLELMSSSEFLDRVATRQAVVERNIVSAIETVFERSGRDELTDDECIAISRSGYLVSVAIELPSLRELALSNRIGIIQDIEFRLALVELQQLRERTQKILESSLVVHLFTKFPDLMRTESYWSEQENEIRLRFDCDLEAMRENTAFRNDLSLNADSFDGFYNQGIRRELDHLQKIRTMVNQILGASRPET